MTVSDIKLWRYYDDSTDVIYDCNMFIIEATAHPKTKYINLTGIFAISLDLSIVYKAFLSKGSLLEQGNLIRLVFS